MTSVDDRLREAAASLKTQQPTIPPFRKVRRRVRRRRLMAFAAVVSVLVAVSFATAATRHDPDRIVVANPGSTSSSSGNPTSTTTNAAARFEGPLASTIGSGIERLDPPEPSDTPTISATAALTPTDGAGNVMHIRARYPGVQPVVRLARFTSASALARSAGRLVWAVIYNDVQLGGGGGAPGPGASAAPAPLEYGVAIIIVDATTGHALLEHDFGPPLTASQLR